MQILCENCNTLLESEKLKGRCPVCNLTGSLAFRATILELTIELQNKEDQISTRLMKGQSVRDQIMLRDQVQDRLNRLTESTVEADRY